MVSSPKGHAPPFYFLFLSGPICVLVMQALAVAGHSLLCCAVSEPHVFCCRAASLLSHYLFDSPGRVFAIGLCLFAHWIVDESVLVMWYCWRISCGVVR